MYTVHVIIRMTHLKQYHAPPPLPRCLLHRQCISTFTHLSVDLVCQGGRSAGWSCEEEYLVQQEGMQLLQKGIQPLSRVKPKRLCSDHSSLGTCRNLSLFTMLPCRQSNHTLYTARMCTRAISPTWTVVNYTTNMFIGQSWWTCPTIFNHIYLIQKEICVSLDRTGRNEREGWRGQSMTS